MRQERCVVVQVLLEKRVVGRDARHPGTAREAYAGVVGDEWRVDVHQVDVRATQRLELAPERPPAHAAVFRVARYARGTHPQDTRPAGADPRGISNLRDIANLCGVLRRDQQRLDALARQVLAEGADGSGDAVDPREVDVGDEEYAHAYEGQRAGRAGLG